MFWIGRHPHTAAAQCVLLLLIHPCLLQVLQGGRAFLNKARTTLCLPSFLICKRGTPQKAPRDIVPHNRASPCAF
jgi:hypothetical protein